MILDSKPPTPSNNSGSYFMNQHDRLTAQPEQPKITAPNPVQSFMSDVRRGNFEQVSKLSANYYAQLLKSGTPEEKARNLTSEYTERLYKDAEARSQNYNQSPNSNDIRPSAEIAVIWNEQARVANESRIQGAAIEKARQSGKPIPFYPNIPEKQSSTTPEFRKIQIISSSGVKNEMIPNSTRDQLTQARDIHGNEIKTADILISGGVKLQQNQRSDKKPSSDLQFRTIGGEARVVGGSNPNAAGGDFKSVGKNKTPNSGMQKYVNPRASLMVRD